MARVASRSVTRIIAHRGASAAFPENTLEAFKAAADLGADEVELDVRPGADGSIVVHHDATVGGGRPVVELSRDELPDGVCLLEEALDICDGANLAVNVEIKALPGDPDHDRADAFAGQVAAVLGSRYGGTAALESTLVSSFWPATLTRVRESDSRLRTGLLCFDLSDFAALIEAVAGGGHTAVNPWEGMLDEDMVISAGRAGLEVNVWTVDDPDRIAELARWGVDGIITNAPDVARQVLGAQ